MAGTGGRNTARRRRPVGLAVHLVALAAAVLLPALAVGAAAVWTAVQGQRAVFEEGMRDAAQAAALAIDTEFERLTAALAAFSTSPAFGPDAAEPDLPALDAQARRIAAGLGAALYVAMPDGTRLLTTRLQPGAPSPRVAARALVETVAATGRPAVGGLVVGSASGVPTVSVGVPVKDRQGRVALVAAASVEATRLGDLLAAQVREGSFATLADGGRLVVARSREHGKIVGERLLPRYVERIDGRATGFYAGPNRFGEGTVGVFRRLSAAAGWVVVLGEPASVYREAAWRPVRELVSGGAATAALALLAACAIGRRILRPVAALRRRAEAVAEGGGPPGATAAEPSTVGEFDDLRLAVLRADATLRAERDRARLYFDAAGAVLLVLDPDGTVRGINRRGLEVLALGGAGAVAGRDWFGNFVPERLRASARGGFAAAAAGRPGAQEARECPVLRADGAERLVVWRDAVLRDDAGAVIAVVSSGEDVTEARAAAERQRLLAREVDHRAKNALAVVQAVLRLSPRNDPSAFVAAVEARVAALARAHSLLAEGGWAGADLREVAERELAAYAAAAGRSRAVSLDGPPVPLAATAVQPVAMVLHELATNAAKHGALSRPGGRVDLRWTAGRAAGGQLRLRWTEAGGPAMARDPPRRRGFGSRVIEATARGQLGGTVERRWEPSGLVVEVALPLARVAPAFTDRGATKAADAA